MKVPIDVIMSLRTMTMAQARGALARFELDETETQSYLKLVPEETDTHTHTRSPRRLGMLVLWLLGGSYRDIAHLHNIAHQTVIDYLDKLLRREDRNKLRLQQRLKHESLVIYAKEFNRRKDLHHMAPIEIAKELLATTDVED